MSSVFCVSCVSWRYEVNAAETDETGSRAIGYAVPSLIWDEAERLFESLLAAAPSFVPSTFAELRDLVKRRLRDHRATAPALRQMLRRG